MVTQVQRNSHELESAAVHRAAAQASDLLRRAEVYLTAGNWQEAARLAQGAVKQTPTALGYKLLGNALLQGKQVQKAQVAYARALKLQPDWAEVHANLGTVFAQQKHWLAALHHFRQALSLKPNLTELQQNLEQLWTQIAESDQSLDLVLKAFVAHPQRFAAVDHVMLGDRLLQQSQPAVAVQCYQRAIERDDSLASAYWNLAVAWEQLGDRPAMLEAYFQAVTLQPTWATAEEHCKLGHDFFQQENWERAEVCYERSIQLNATLADAYLGLGMVLQKQNKLERAIETYQAAIKLQPDAWQIYHNLGKILLTQQKWQESVVVYEKAIALNPHHSWLHHDLGDALVRLELWEAAVTSYQKAINLKSDFHWSYHNLGDALLGLGKWDEAVVAYQTAMNLAPDMPFVASKLQYSLQQQAKQSLTQQLPTPFLSKQKMGGTKQMPELVLKLENSSSQVISALVERIQSKGFRQEKPVFLSASSDDPNYYIEMGNDYLKKNQVDIAINSYLKALELDSENSDLYRQIGDALVQKGNIEEASFYYCRALYINSDF